jgi:hypothetical protein
MCVPVSIWLVVKCVAGVRSHSVKIVLCIIVFLYSDPLEPLYVCTSLLFHFQNKFSDIVLVSCLKSEYSIRKLIFFILNMLNHIVFPVCYDSERFDSKETT